MKTSLLKFVTAISVVAFLWFAIPSVLGAAAFYFDGSVVLVRVLLAFVVVTVFLFAIRFAKPGYKLTIAHALAAFAASVAVYVWLTLGSFSEFSAMLLLEPFVTTLLASAALVYLLLAVASRRRPAV